MEAIFAESIVWSTLMYLFAFVALCIWIASLVGCPIIASKKGYSALEWFGWAFLLSLPALAIIYAAPNANLEEEINRLERKIRELSRDLEYEQAKYKKVDTLK